MKTIVPDYYSDFRCIAGSCRHTCCEGWEIEVDEMSLQRFLKEPKIAEKIEIGETPHIKLLAGERCPFLDGSGLCRMILDYGEDMLCGICRDHPRFRNYWSDRTELGLGLVCEEAAKLILSREKPMTLVVLEDDGKQESISENEQWLISYRDELLSGINVEGCRARLLEYLIYRHLSDALYDGLVEERTAFVLSAYNEILDNWEKTDGSFDSLVECARAFSYDVEYDDEVLEKRVSGLEEHNSRC